MAQADWTTLLNVAPTSVIRRGVVAAGVNVTVPNGGESFCYGFNSISNTAGCVAHHLAALAFNPTVSGGSIRGALRRGTTGSSASGMSTFLYIGLSGTDVSDTAYSLGLSDDEPSNLILRKGVLSEGIIANAPGNPSTLGTLRRSNASYLQGEWVHVRLDMVVNGTGDVVLHCYVNDLDSNSALAPVWEEISGMDAYIDDALGINTGSLPLVSGRVGYGYQSAASARRGFVDVVQALYQVP